MTQTTTTQTEAAPDVMGRSAMAATDRAGMAAPAGQSNVTALHPREAMAFDQARLAQVCDAHGSDAETYIACILDEVEMQVAAAASRATDAGALGRSCGDIVALSDAIGMVTMRQAAQAVLDCIAGGADVATRTACLHRLLRLGRPSGTGGWEMTRKTGPDTVA